MILAILLAAAAAARPVPASQGRLVVLVVVDQLRYQDLLWLAPEFGPKGFAGMGRPMPMRYDTVVTETAADHAVLSTGAYADLNGIVGNRFWVDGVSREAVDDPQCPVWGGLRGRSAASLRVPTVGDALKLGTNGQSRVVSVSVKDRSALFLAGPSADMALWYEVDDGQLSSSTCYAPEPAWVPRDVAARYRDYTWTMGRPDVIARLLPDSRAAGAVPRLGIGDEFPHKIGEGALDERLYAAVARSPASTTIALQAAREALKAYKLGENGGADYFALALSAVDGVGHEFGTLARERVDVILRMHEELGAFLDELRARFGPRLSVVLTADHGLTPVLADEKRLRVPQGGSVSIDELVPKLEKALAAELGPREQKWVLGIEGDSLFLRPPFPPRAVDIAANVLRQEPGIWQVIKADEIQSAMPAARHAWFPGRSGQLLLVTRPLWTLKKHFDAADHGSPWNDDAMVPLMIKAPGFRVRGEPVLRATQVAPTVAALLDISPPAAALDLPAIEHE